jgi:anti-sigma factor RsiW
MKLDAGPHVAEDVLEKYLMNHLTELEKASVEEHLLACPFCQDQTQETEAFILAARAALREPVRKPAARAARAGTSGAMLSWFSAPVVAMASLGLAIGTYLAPSQVSNGGPPVEVRLSAMRGADTALPRVHTGSRLILSLDARDLPPGEPYYVRVVNAAGAEVWSGVPQRLGDRLQAELAGRLMPGRYWVRLSRGGEPVREYGVAVLTEPRP